MCAAMLAPASARLRQTTGDISGPMGDAPTGGGPCQQGLSAASAGMPCAGGLIYYSSASGNTARFMARLGLHAQRIPISPKHAMPEPQAPFVLVCPTYADGQGRGAVARQVIHFLNDPRRRGLLRGVIASGNRNFGRMFACAGRVIADKCQVPVLYRFELAGTDTDIARVRAGLARFWEMQCLTP